MRSRLLLTVTALLLVASACTNSAAPDTSGTPTSTTTTSTTTTLVPTTSTGATTTEAATTTTTTVDPTTTTTSEGSGETSTTTTTRVSATTTTTTDPPPDADPDLVRWAGLFRQPTTYTGFLEFQANGIIRAGNAYDQLDIVGRWDYDSANDEFIFSDFDFGAGCGGAEGRYARETARGGGRRITLVEDPCEDRVNFITQPGSTCQCFLYLKVELPDSEG